MNQHNARLPFSTTTTATISLHQKTPFPTFPPPKHHQQRSTKTNPDTELSIFSAERYFKEDDLHKDTPTVLPPSPFKKPQHITTTILPVHYPRTPSSTTHHLSISAITTSTTSEASWNSQMGLLPPNPPSCNSLSPTPRRSPKWRFRYPTSCPCSGKRSVDVEEKFSEFKSSYLSSSTYGSSSVTFTPAKQTTKDDPQPPIAADEQDVGFLVPGIARLKILPGKWEKTEEAFSFPHDDDDSNNNNAFSFPILAKPTTAADEDKEPPRDSLEVFRPREGGCSPSAVTPRRRSAELLGQCAPRHPPTEEMRRSFTFSESPRGLREDDLASDASSDLFEIESFSTSMAPPPPPLANRRRESLDEPEIAGAGDGSARLSGCYPPSEVSVQWSVATAEGYASLANFSSAASECGGPAAERETSGGGGGGVAGRKRGGGGGGGGVGGGGGLLMRCRSTKAVDVAPPIMQHVAEGRRRGPERPALTRSLSARANRPVQGV